MERDRFKRAKARLERAWNEAKYLYNRRDAEEQAKLFWNGGQVLDATETLSAVFDGLEKHPCGDCKRCCSQAAFSTGFHTHTERETILAELSVNYSKYKHPMEYVVGPWEGPGWRDEPPDRCLFLKKDGCNLPPALLSEQCSSYVCRDKLGPALVAEGLGVKYKKARGKRSAALRVLQDSLADLDFELNVDSLGDG